MEPSVFPNLNEDIKELDYTCADNFSNGNDNLFAANSRNNTSSSKKVEFTDSLGESNQQSNENLSVKDRTPSTNDISSQSPQSANTLQNSIQMEKLNASTSKGGVVSGTTTPVRRRSSPTSNLMNEIRKMSLASQDAKEDRKLKKFRRFQRRKRKEEEYTDKDRAAAVTLGSRDIKQSLRAKKKRERKLCVSIDLMSREDLLSDMLLNEATHQMRVKDISMALSTLDKALELQPHHKTALIARSQCYLKLGDGLSALKDAKASCETDRFILGLFHYAEALYNLGEFEKALISYHKGFELRKEIDGFRIGIQKCEEAIEKCIGDPKATQIEDLDEILPLIYEVDNFKNQKSKCDPETSQSHPLAELDDKIVERFNGRLRAPSKSRSRWISREVLGQMYFDKNYLTHFLNRIEPRKDGVGAELRESAVEALDYLNIREEFWRQQNPMYARKTGFNFSQNILLTHDEDDIKKTQQKAGRKNELSIITTMNEGLSTDQILAAAATTSCRTRTPCIRQDIKKTPKIRVTTSTLHSKSPSVEISSRGRSPNL